MSIAVLTATASRAESQTTVFSNVARDAGISRQICCYGFGGGGSFTYLGPSNMELFSLGLDVIMYYAGNLRITFSSTGSRGELVQSWLTRGVGIDAPLFFERGNRLMNGVTYNVYITAEAPPNPEDATPQSLNDAAYYRLAEDDNAEGGITMMMEVKAVRVVAEPSTGASLMAAMAALSIAAIRRSRRQLTRNHDGPTLAIEPGASEQTAVH